MLRFVAALTPLKFAFFYIRGGTVNSDKFIFLSGISRYQAVLIGITYQNININNTFMRLYCDQVAMYWKTT
jgi:hypothetical protein